jgi:hypothetical protein
VAPAVPTEAVAAAPEPPPPPLIVTLEIRPGTRGFQPTVRVV